MGCKPGAHRHNARNECIQLRALLKLAYKALRQNRCLVPRELVLWMRAQKEIPVAEKMSAELTVAKVQEEFVREGFDGKDI